MPEGPSTGIAFSSPIRDQISRTLDARVISNAGDFAPRFSGPAIRSGSENVERDSWLQLTKRR
jgi:hypothetical protein